MAADVIKAAQLALGTTHQQQRLAVEFSREEITRLQQLLATPNYLPGAREDAFPFLRVHLGMGVEARRN